MVNNKTSNPDTSAGQKFGGFNKKLQKVSKSSRTAGYVGVFLLAISIVAVGYYKPTSQNKDNLAQSTAPIGSSFNSATAINTSAPSADELSAISVASVVAETTQMPVASNIRQASDSLSAKIDLSQNAQEVISKPQVVQPGSSDREIATYTTKEGDTVESVATEYKVSTQTIKWANNLTEDKLEVGKELSIPKVDGVIYTIKSGDKLDDIVSKYKADKERVILYNDLNELALTEGSRIVLPGGELPENERPGYQAPVQSRSSSASTSTSAGSSSAGQVTGISNSLVTASAGNRYAYGYCTWYVYEKRPDIGSFWGNAYSWASSARAAGYSVGNTPVAGSILQTSAGGGGYGHVAYVERVDSQYVYVSEMNYAGWNVVSNRAIPISQAGMYNYIY